MNELNEQEIGKLLRLKRFEQPPPAYFDNFLHEFHRRQRDELLREPLWRLTLQRVHDFLFRLQLPSLASYPVAAAAVLVCAAVVSLKVYQTPQPANQLAQQVPLEFHTPSTQVAADSDWSLAKPIATRDFSSPLFRNVKESAYAHPAAATPRYVLDATPVSYETAFTF